MNTLSEELLQDIAYSLDRLKGNEEYWRLLILKLPKKTYPYNKVDVEKIAFVGISGKGSPSLLLLRDLQKKGMEISHFKSLLQIIECQGALDCFKKPTKPVIHTHPVSVTVNVNERLELQCIANCVPEPPDYQWFYYAPNGTSPVPLKGRKNWMLVIDKVAMNNTGYYCCRVQNRRLKEDHYAVFSKYATVMVKDNTEIIPEQEETDRGHVILKSEPPASIRDVNDGVKVSCPEESTGTVSPHELIRILTQPESQTVRLKRAEETITLHCQAESVRGQQLEYKWYYLRGNENPAALNKESKTVKSTEPHIDITLRLSNKQERRYFCEVSVAGDPEHFVASEVAVIRLQCVWFVEQPEKKYVAVTGKELKLTCRVETAPEVTVKYQWFQCQQGGMGKQPTSCYDNVMVLPAIIANQGYYLCSVMVPSSESIHSDVAQVEVVNSTDITIKDSDQPPSDRYVELNEKLVIKITATCKKFPVKYQWYYNFVILPDCTNSTLIIDAIGVHHIGPYHCEVSSDYSAMSVISETCRVHWRGSNPSLPTINRQQIDAEEVLMVDNRIYATEKMALLIGNSSYKGKPLKCSKNDVEAVTNKLQQLNFKTISLVDLTLSQMAKAVDYFCSLLDHGMYAMLYYSGHGLELNKTTYLMPIDADEPVKIDQCMNADDVAAKMQARKAKVFMILDCCRINLDARSVQPLSSVPFSINHARAFSNLCQLFACSPSFETYENKDGHHSYMTEAFLQEVDKADSVMQALKLSSDKKYDNQKFPGRVAPRPQLVLQMDVADKISFHDPILNEHELKEKELLLNLPKTCCLEFTNPKLKNACGQVELRFSAKFSNVMIVQVVCNADLQPEVVVLGEKAELECGIQKENDKIITSFKIADLLDVVQDKNSKLQISFQMPEDSSAKDTLDYRIPANLIKPLFHHH